MRSRAAATLAACLVAVLPTAGCYQGSEGTVNTQPPTGNGTDFHVGDLLVQDTTIVASPANPKRASVVFTVINDGETDDALATVKVGTTEATIRTAPLAAPSGQAVQVGGPSENQVVVGGLDISAGSYADVVVTFRNAGASEPQRVLVVPAEGYYAGWGPAAAVLPNE